MGRDEAKNGAVAPGRRKRPPLVSRRQAIDAAYVLITGVGPGGLSMRKLATALHVSLPTVYTAIDSRETLIGELQDRMVAEIASALAIERLAEPGTDIEDVAADLLSWAEQRPQLARFLIVEPMSASVAERLLERATQEQRAGARAMVAGLADAASLADRPGPVGDAPGPDPLTGLAFVFAEVRAMLWLVMADGPLAADPATWLSISCANITRGLGALATGRTAPS